MSSNALAIRLQSENLRTLAFGSISGTYAGLGTALNNSARKLLFVNDTDALLTFSDDGVNDKFVLPAGAMFILDITLDKGGDYIAQGTRYYVKGAPSVRLVYLSSWYGAL